MVAKLLFPLLLFLVPVLNIQAQRRFTSDPIVRTQYGPILGSFEYSQSGRRYSSFKAIPYAQPPVGQLRFRPPQPPLPWRRVLLDARQDAPFCIQQNTLFEAGDQVRGQEDCLYLNVYVPDRKEYPFPVMVFIHYGAFYSGRSASDHLGPEYLMDKDVILVTFNYRLGVFGFLSTLDDESPGNYAFKDQVAALQWVRDNIANFGGNPYQVTIFGQSAGAGSVHIHMLSPASKGLFHRAISQSGTALNLWMKPINELQKNVTALQASFVGCGHFLYRTKDLMRCLRNVDAEELAASASKFKYFFNEPLTVFTLVVEKLTPFNQKPFITKEPIEYIKSGDFNDVPWITGVVRDEGILRVAPLLRQPVIREILNTNFDHLLPLMMYLQFSTLNNDNLWKNIKTFYLKDQNFINTTDSTSIQGFIDLYTDRAFLYGTYQSVQLHASLNRSPVWVYNFDYRGQYSYGDLFAITNQTIDFNWGVSHCDDLIYLFKSPIYFPPLQDYSDKYIRDVMVHFWTNFAIFGAPDPLQDLPWRPVNGKLDATNLQFLNITGSVDRDDVTLEISTGFYPDRIKFWSNQTLLENDYHTSL